MPLHTTDWALIRRCDGRAAHRGFDVVAVDGRQRSMEAVRVELPRLLRDSPAMPDVIPGVAASCSVSFGPDGRGGVSVVATLVDPTDRDADTIAEACLEWPVVAYERPTYRGLAQAAREMTQRLARDLPQEPQQHSLPLELDCLDAERIAEEVDGFGRNTVAGIAGLVLDRPVTVNVPASWSFDDRLALLDRVAALLPYRVRAHLAASTWVDGPQPAMRISGSVRGRPAKVDLTEPAWNGSQDRAGERTYAGLVLSLAERVGTVAVVKRHAGLTDLRPPDAATIVDEMRDFDQLHWIWADRENSTLSLPELRKSLDRLDDMLPGQLPDEARHAFGARLLDNADPDDAAFVAALLGPGESARIAAAIRTVLGRSKGPDVGWLITLAHERSDIEGVLRELLPTGKAIRKRPRLPGRSRGITDRHRVLGTIADELPPVAGGWPELRNDLLDASAAELVHLIALRQVSGPRGRDGAAAMMTWLAEPGTLPAHLVPLDHTLRVLPAVGTVDDPRLGDLLQKIDTAIEEGDPVDLLWARCRAGQLFAQQDRDLVTELTELRVDPGDRAKLDLIRLRLGMGLPVSVVTQLGAAEGADYGGAFLLVYRDPRLPDTERWQLGDRLIRHLDGQDWNQDVEELLQFLLYLVVAQSPNDPDVRRVTALVARHAVDPVLQATTAYWELWDAKVAGSPEDPLAELGPLRAVRDRISQEALITRASHVLTDGGIERVEPLLKAVGGSPLLVTGQQISDFLIRTWQSLPEPHEPEQVAVYWALVDGVHDGHLGADADREYRPFVRDLAPQEIRRWSDQLLRAGVARTEITAMLRAIAADVEAGTAGARTEEGTR